MKAFVKNEASYSFSVSAAFSTSITENAYTVIL